MRFAKYDKKLIIIFKNIIEYIKLYIKSNLKNLFLNNEYNF